jgi:hypothetical protein
MGTDILLPPRVSSQIVGYLRTSRWTYQIADAGADYPVLRRKSSRQYKYSVLVTALDLFRIKIRLKTSEQINAVINWRVIAIMAKMMLQDMLDQARPEVYEPG